MTYLNKNLQRPSNFSREQYANDFGTRNTTIYSIGVTLRTVSRKYQRNKQNCKIECATEQIELQRLVLKETNVALRLLPQHIQFCSSIGYVAY